MAKIEGYWAKFPNGSSNNINLSSFVGAT